MVSRNPPITASSLLRPMRSPNVLPVSQEPILLLDLGCGSGASTRAIVDAFGQRIERVKIIGIDASAGMLKQARDKPGPAAYGSNVPLRNSCR